MPTAPKTPPTKTTAAALPKSKAAPAAKAATVVKSTAKAAGKAAVGTEAGTTPRTRKLTPAAPETKAPTTARRKKLSKAFSRPLDKKPAKMKLVRDRFTMPEVEYEQLVQMKKRLSALGITIKKSELVRAGLLQLAAMDDEKLKAATAKLPLGKVGD